MTSAILARSKANFECLDTHARSVTVLGGGAQVKEQSKKIVLCQMRGPDMDFENCKIMCAEQLA